MVFSHVGYCIQVYGGTSVCAISKIQKIFNFAARVISGRRKYDHISDLLKQYKWLEAPQFIAFSDMCMLYKIVTSGEPTLLASQFSFNRDVVDRHTRQSDQLALFRPRTNHGKRCYVYRSSALLNHHFGSQVPEVLSASTRVAKKCIREHCAAPARS